MHNLLKSRKAQFFILSAFAIVSILYFVSKWIQPASIIDTAQIILIEEPFVFSNLKEKAIEMIKKSKNCEELSYNLEEYKNFAERYASEKNLELKFNYTISCPPPIVEIEMSLKSTYSEIKSNFTVDLS
jgi:hypothetical protein